MLAAWAFGAAVSLGLSACDPGRFWASEGRFTLSEAGETLSLAPGERYSSTGYAGDEVRADKRFGDTCHGLVPEAAQQLLHVTEPVSVRMVARGSMGEDLVMVLHGANGTLCSDDYDGLSPGMALRLGPGDHHVYVGVQSPRGAEPLAYTLEIEPAVLGDVFDGLSPSELGEEIVRLREEKTSLTPRTLRRLRRHLGARAEGDEAFSVSSSSGVLEGPPRHGTLVWDSSRSTVERYEVRAGGAAAIWQLSGVCAGFVAPGGPELRVRVRERGESMMVLIARSSSDTALALRDPHGRWRCSDDVLERNPRLVVEAPEPGDYELWVSRVGSKDPTDAVLFVASDAAR